MYLLDTNSLDLYLLGNPNLVQRIAERIDQIQISSVTAEERLVGRMNGINRARAPRTSLSLVKAHEDLVQALEDLRVFPVLTYSEEADAIYKTFSPAQLRVGTQDCRIAAQAIAHNLTVVTRNVRDFEAIGAPCTDWSL